MALISIISQINIAATITGKATLITRAGSGLTIQSFANAQVIRCIIVKGTSASSTSASTIMADGKLIRYIKSDVTASTEASGSAYRYKTLKSNVSVQTNIEAFYSDRDIKRDMLDMIPRYYDDSRIVQFLMKAKSHEIVRINTHIQRVLNQFYIDLADEMGIERWEVVCGIKPQPDKPLEERRSLVKAKLRGIGTTKAPTLKQVVDAFYESEVTERNEEYGIDIKIVGKRGEPRNIDDIKSAVNDVIPAHIEPGFYFSYMPWQELEDAAFMWGDISYEKMAPIMASYPQPPTMTWAEAGNKKISELEQPWNQMDSRLIFENEREV